MTRYNDRGGNSGVFAYEIGADYIKVHFDTGSIYLYNYLSAGKSNIDQMKSLAINGQGLNSFIKMYVKNRYAAKLR